MHDFGIPVKANTHMFSLALWKYHYLLKKLSLNWQRLARASKFIEFLKKVNTLFCTIQRVAMCIKRMTENKS